MTSIPDVITHYQRSIEKNAKDPKRLLHCLEQLYKLDITVQHLQDTGIGRTVNTLRKAIGPVGVVAKTLVAKWKATVTAHETESAESCAEDDQQHLNHGGIVDSAGPSPNDRRRSDTKTDDTNLHITNHTTPRSSSSSSNSLSISTPSLKEPPSINMSSGYKSTSSNSSKSNTAGRHDKPASSSLNKLPASSSSSSHSSNNKSSNGRSSHHKSSRSSASGSGSSHEHHAPASVVAVEPSKLTQSPTKKRKAADEPSKHRASKASKVETESPPPSVEKADKKTNKAPSMEEIDSSMGTSFAEALGMMMPSKKSAGSNKSKPIASTSSSRSSFNPPASTSAASSTALPSKTSSASKPTATVPSTASSSSSGVPDRKSTTMPSTTKPIVHKRPTAPPTLLTSAAHLAPLDPEIAVAISNDYKPMPLNPIVMDCVFRSSSTTTPTPMSSGAQRTMTDAELGASMSSKNMRTKVYSGVKSGALLNVPTLHEMCIRILQRNIEALEATGGVPFEILKPVLERATPEQLFTLEDYNPYLIDDTDGLWKGHCSRKFRGKLPNEFESWRDMFLRCREEQELRLSNLTENIKRTQTVAVPLKQTKITFVDSAVKPPRDVLKKQARFGTERTPVCTPAARVAALSTTSNIARPGDARLRAISGMRDHAQVGARVARKAPLMQKTLQHMKGLFKR